MERLDLRLVEYFVAVAEELHFGRAAERLHIAQPSLSQQIRRFEAQLGVTLLERTNRRVRLTKAGAALLRDGRELLAAGERVIRSTRAAAGHLRLGFYGSAASTLLPDILSAFGEQHPSFDVTVRELLLGSLDDVLEGNVDLAFTRLLPGQADLEVEVLAEEPRMAALPSGHHLARRSALNFADLDSESFIVNPAARADGPPPRWMAEQRRHGFPGRVAAEATSIQEILTLVAAERGICLVPSAVAQHYPRAGVVYVPVRDAEPAVVSLAWRPGGFTPGVKALVDTARKVCRA